MESHLLRGAECSLFFRYTSWLTLYAINYLKQSITENKRVGGGTMAMEYALTFYASKQWHKCRQAYIAERQAIDGGMCERCHDELGYIVHHKTYVSPSNINDPDVTLNFENFKYVCQNCHNAIHFGSQIELTYAFDSNGQPIPIEKFDG